MVASRTAAISAAGSPKSATAVAVSLAPRLARKESQEDMKGNVAAVYCEFKYSGVAHGFPIVAAFASLALLALTPIEPLLRAAAALAVIGLGFRAWRTAHAVRALRLDGAGAIEVSFADGSSRQGVVPDGSFVAPWLTLIRWRPEGALWDRTILMLPGMTATEDYRRIRVILRWG